MSPLQERNSSLVPNSAPLPTSPDGGGDTITIVFGILALVVGIVTIWQSYRTYQGWYPATTGVDHGATRAYELETIAESLNEDNISLQPGNSQESRTSNAGGSDASV